MRSAAAMSRGRRLPNGRTIWEPAHPRRRQLGEEISAATFTVVPEHLLGRHSASDSAKLAGCEVSGSAREKAVGHHAAIRKKIVALPAQDVVCRTPPDQPSAARVRSVTIHIARQTHRARANRLTSSANQFQLVLAIDDQVSEVSISPAYMFGNRSEH